MSNIHRSVQVSLCALLLITSSVIGASAAPFGQSSSKSSSSSKPASYGRSSVSTPSKVIAPTPQPRGGIGSGGNVGVARPAVSNAVRTGQPIQSPTPYARPVTPPVPTNNNRVNPPQTVQYPNNSQGQYAQPQKQGHSTGALVGAAAGAAAVGYMLGTSGDNTAQAQQAGQTAAGQVVAPVAGQAVPQGQAIDPNMVQQGQSPMASPVQTQQTAPVQEEGSSWLWLIALIGAGLGAFWLLRKKPASASRNAPYTQVTPPVNSPLQTEPQTPVVSPVVPTGNEFSVDANASLEKEKEALFRKIQENNRPSCLDIVRHATTPDLFNQISPLLEQSSDTRRVDVRDFQATVVNVAVEQGKTLGSVVYQANIVESDEGRDSTVTPVHEIWHFELQNDRWKLAGIEQV